MRVSTSPKFVQFTSIPPMPRTKQELNLKYEYGEVWNRLFLTPILPMMAFEVLIYKSFFAVGLHWHKPPRKRIKETESLWLMLILLVPPDSVKLCIWWRSGNIERRDLVCRRIPGCSHIRKRWVIIQFSAIHIRTRNLMNTWFCHPCGTQFSLLGIIWFH